MKVEHYMFWQRGERKWRWRVLGDDARPIAIGQRIHDTKDDSRAELRSVISFLSGSESHEATK